MTHDDCIAVIYDIVDSRRLADRSEGQVIALDALRVGDGLVDVVQGAYATVGDEFQAIYATLADALVATLATALALPDGVQMRCGLGAGEIRDVHGAGAAVIQDGSAWWHARDAIEEARALARRRVPSCRSWFACDDAAVQATVDAYLLSRDHVVAALGARGRRLASGLLAGSTQRSLARTEGISESAVSQAVRDAGISALVEGAKAMQAAAS